MKLLFLFVPILLGGCATAHFRPYEGGQQNWPTSTGAIVERNHGVPAYFGYPPRPYRVIGSLDATTAPARRSGVVAFATRRAKELGGDAIIVRSESSEYAGTYNTGSAQTYGTINPNPMFPSFSGTTTTSGVSVALMKGKADVLVIKWK